MTSVIRVVARITPYSDVSSGTNEHLVPAELGDPISVEMCRVTDPRTGLQYLMETSIIVKKYASSKDISKEVASECESVPGFVCATSPVLSMSPDDNLNSNQYATLSVPKSIRRDKIPQLLKSSESKKNPSLKLRVDLKEIKKGSRHNHALKKARNRLLKPLLKYFIENECVICGFMTSRTSKVVISKHLSEHIRGSSYICDCCDITFTAPNDLYVHKLTKATVLPYSCDTCNTQYQRKHLLTVHQLKNHSLLSLAAPNNDQGVWKQKIPPWYSCSVCGDRMASMEDISMHKSYHSSKESYQCLFCGKSFVNNCLLRYHSHIRLVTSSRALKQQQKSVLPLTCKLCGDKKFYLKETFLGHMRLIHGTN